MIAQKLSAEQLDAFEKIQRAAGQHHSRDGSGEMEEQKKPTQAEILLSIADKKLILFHDQHKEPFCSVQNKTYPLKASRVKDILSYEYYKQTGKAPNSDALTQAISTLKGKALFEAPTIKLHNRVAFHEFAIWYDMADGTATKIMANHWEQTEVLPILFRNYSHQKKQVLPAQDGTLWDVFDFLNVESKNQLLVAVYIVSCFIPDIPHPIFHPHGAQGSGKTTFCCVLKSLIDPSELSTMIMQRDYAQLIQAIAHHHFVPFDNLSDLPGWASDILAIACTGGGLSKRQLYTDEDDIVLSVRRCIGINAINLLIQRADLMDRAILLHLDRIAPSRRKDETQFWLEFEQKKAGILGGIFNTLSRAMAIYSKVRLQYLPRMADFAKWGYAIGEALKRGGGDDFLKSYADNISKQNEEIILSNTLIIAILKEMNEKDLWEGTIKTVYERLVEIAAPDKHDPTFPKTERKLRTHLERAKTTLAQQGIHFTIGDRTAQGIPITFKRTDFPEDTKISSFDTFASSNTQEQGAVDADNVDNVANEANFHNSGNQNVLDFTGETIEVVS